MNRSSRVIFNDLVLLIVGCLIIVIYILIPHLNPPGKGEEEVNMPPETMYVEIFWPDDNNTDMDLWVRGPGETNGIGYSNKGGKLFNLVRDDLGRGTDISGRNYERTESRGLLPGKYVINVHAYRGGVWPLEVTVVVSVKRSPQEGASQILSTVLTFTRQSIELTAFSFRLDHEFNLVPDSVSEVFEPVRRAGMQP